MRSTEQRNPRRAFVDAERDRVRLDEVFDVSHKTPIAVGSRGVQDAIEDQPRYGRGNDIETQILEPSDRWDVRANEQTLLVDLGMSFDKLDFESEFVLPSTDLRDG